MLVHNVSDLTVSEAERSASPTSPRSEGPGQLWPPTPESTPPCSPRDFGGQGPWMCLVFIGMLVYIEPRFGNQDFRHFTSVSAQSTTFWPGIWHIEIPSVISPEPVALPGTSSMQVEDCQLHRLLRKFFKSFNCHELRVPAGEPGSNLFLACQKT